MKKKREPTFHTIMDDDSHMYKVHLYEWNVNSAAVQTMLYSQTVLIESAYRGYIGQQNYIILYFTQKQN